jgi:hypothetical protein
MKGKEPDRRLKLEAEILFYLWAEGATPLYRLLELLQASRPEARFAISNLADKRYIYKLFEPPGGEVSSVYYLTTPARNRLQEMFHGEPRYHLKQLWHCLKQEETAIGLPHLRLS